jgi:trk system potassium uptake protein TrkA
MKVIICGAGQVGSGIARQLASEDNDVTVVDQSPDLIRKIGDTLDVKAMVGFASHPSILELAGAGDSDMIIAVTFADEVNMVACQVAHSLFEVPKKIARVREQNYLMPIWSDLFSPEHMPIDVIISPEVEVARAISRRLHAPGASEMISLADGKVRLIGVRCTEQTPIVNTPLRQLTALFPDLNIVVVAVIRGETRFVPHGDDQLSPGDEVYFVADSEHGARAMAAFGHEEPEAHRIVIIGGGHIGLYLARMIEEQAPGIALRMIERDDTRAKGAAQILTRAIVLHGDGLDPEILEEANIRSAETFIAVTEDDETNILASLLAKGYGCPRTVTLINRTTYTPLISPLGVDVIVNPRTITVSTILQHVRRGRIRAVHSLGEGFGEVIEADALETSSLIGTPLRETKLPSDVIIGAIIRDGEVTIPRGDSIVRANDRVVLFAPEVAIKKVEKMFAVRLEYF